MTCPDCERLRKAVLAYSLVERSVIQCQKDRPPIRFGPQSADMREWRHLMGSLAQDAVVKRDLMMAIVYEIAGTEQP